MGKYITLPQDKYPKLTEEDILKGIAELSYQSPVDIVYQGFHTQLEGDIYKAIQSYGICVDKDELVKALKYDRDQYKKGFADGYKAMPRKIKADIAMEILDELEEVLCGEYLTERFWFDLGKLRIKYTEDKNE